MAINQPLLRTGRDVKAFLKSKPGSVLYFNRVMSGSRGEIWSGPVRPERIATAFHSYAAFRQIKPLYRVKVTRKA
ncbi:hypothetical protein [Agrobacterium sp. CG674]